MDAGKLDVAVEVRNNGLNTIWSSRNTNYWA